MESIGCYCEETLFFLQGEVYGEEEDEEEEKKLQSISIKTIFNNNIQNIRLI